MATSWHKSREHYKALNELKLAEREGASGWLFDFYYGRALNCVGDYIRSIIYLSTAFKERGNRPELLHELSQSYYLSGKMFVASKYVIMQALSVITLRPISFFSCFLKAISYIAIGLFCLAAKASWKVTRYIPLIRNLQIKFLSPDEPEFTLGNMLIEKGNYKSAEHNFRLSCKILPAKAENHANLALSLALQGLKDEALKECDKSIELSPKNEYFKHTRNQIISGNMKRIVDQHGKVLRTI